MTGRNKQEEEKLSFISKFFPNCTHTPGGTVKLNKELPMKRDWNLGHPRSGKVKLMYGQNIFTHLSQNEKLGRGATLDIIFQHRKG